MRAASLLLVGAIAGTVGGQAPAITSKGDPSVSADTIYRLAVDPAQHRGENYVVLFDDDVERVDAAGRGTHTYRQVVQLLTVAGVNSWRMRFLPYDPTTGKVRVNWAHSVLADGTVISKGVEGTLPYAIHQRDPIYDHLSRTGVAFRGVEPGAILDVSYQVETEGALEGAEFPTVWRAGSLDAAVLRSRLVVEVPDSLALHITERNLEHARRETSANGRRCYTWTTRDVPRVVLEPFMADSSAAYRSVRISTVGSWEALGHWYSARSSSRFTPGDRTRRKTAALTQSARSWSDTLYAIYTWVAQDMQRLRLPTIYSAFRPQTPDETVERFLGDSQDKSVLLVAMLREAHIDATLVLAFAPGDTVVRFPSPLLLQSALVRITHGADTIYGDPMSRYLPPGVLSRPLQGALALVLLGGDSVQVGHLPRDIAGGNEVRSVIVGRMDSSGTVAWRHTLSLGGFTQSRTREAFASGPDSSSQRRELTTVTQFDVPGGGVADSLAGFDGHDLRATAEYSFSVSDGHQRTEGGSTILLLPFGDFSRYVAAAEWLSHHAPRREAIEMAAITGDTAVSYDLRLTLPSGWRALLPPDVNSVSPFGTVIRTYEQEGAVLHLAQRVVGTHSTVPAARASEVLAWLRLVTEHRARYIVIRHRGG